LTPLTPARFARLLGWCGLGWLVAAGLASLVGSTGSFAAPASSDAWRFRLELVVVASLVGAALSAAGVAYQSVLRNPLAEPYLLGASTGASLSAYLWRLPAIGAALASLHPLLGAISQPVMAFGGAVLAVAVVFALAMHRGRIDPLRAILVGVIVNSLLASVYLLLNELIKELPGAGGTMSFLVGAVQASLSSGQLLAATVFIAIGWMALLSVAPALSAAQLGDDEAAALGVRVHRLRWVALGAGSLVTAAAVAISGPIAFVGLICPHAARLLVGHDTRKLLPVATAIGAAALVLADAASRWLGHADRLGVVLPVGVLTSLLGGPVFLWLLARRER